MLDSLDRIDRLMRKLDRYLEQPGPPLAPPTDIPSIGGTPLYDLIPRFKPGFQAPYHLSDLVDELELAIAPHEGQRFYWFSVPPGHFKTSTLVAAIAKHLHRWPESPCGYFSHTDDFATEKSQEVRGIVEETGLHFKRGSDRKDKWQLDTGAKFYSGGITHVDAGIRLRLAVVDDPLKGRIDAESQAIRNKVFQAIEDDLRPRLLPDGCIFLVHTRWHPDDPIGRYKKRRNWGGKNIPALSGATFDEALLPSLWSVGHLKALKNENPYSFEALYQGNPVPPGSEVFGPPTVYTWDSGLPTSGYQVGYGVDLAYTSRTASDFSVCLRLLKVPTNEFEPTDKLDPKTRQPAMRRISHYYVQQVSRAQVKAPEFALSIKGMHTAQPGAMLAYIATSEMGSAQFVAERVSSMRYMVAKVDKRQRALRVAEAWNKGHVRVPGGEDRPAWVEAFLDEVTNFTGIKDAHDDQVDALAAAFDVLNEGSEPTPPGKLETYDSPLQGW